MLGSVEVFSSSTLSWTLLPPMRIPRRGCKAVARYPEPGVLEIMVFGGEDEDDFFAAVERIVLRVSELEQGGDSALLMAHDTSRWNAEPAMLQPRSDFGLCSLHDRSRLTRTGAALEADLDGAVVVAGGFEEGAPLDTVEIKLDPVSACLVSAPGCLACDAGMLQSGSPLTSSAIIVPAAALSPSGPEQPGPCRSTRRLVQSAAADPCTRGLLLGAGRGWRHHRGRRLK
eukprot:SAG22_NODE_1577_length_4074_cov_1.659371_4_plen_229_part_00